MQPPHRRSQVKQRSRLARAVFQGRRSAGGLPGQGPPRREADRNGCHLRATRGPPPHPEMRAGSRGSCNSHLPNTHLHILQALFPQPSPGLRLLLQAWRPCQAWEAAWHPPGAREQPPPFSTESLHAGTGAAMGAAWALGSQRLLGWVGIAAPHARARMLCLLGGWTQTRGGTWQRFLFLLSCSRASMCMQPAGPPSLPPFAWAGEGATPGVRVGGGLAHPKRCTHSAPAFSREPALHRPIPRHPDLARAPVVQLCPWASPPSIIYLASLYLATVSLCCSQLTVAVAKLRTKAEADNLRRENLF